MASSIRVLRAHDLVAYFAFLKGATRSDGVVLLGKLGPPTPLRSFLLQSLLMDPSRQRWACWNDKRIVATLGVRALPGVDIWDIDECFALPDHDGRLGRLRLLNRLGEEAVEDGIQKLMLRAVDDGELESIALQADFAHYATEHVYFHPPVNGANPGRPTGWRSRRGRDNHALFQLYNAVVPGRVRQVEAMTMHEWRANDGWRRSHVRFAPGLDLMRRDYVLEHDGAIVAWVQMNGRRHILRFLCRSDFRSVMPEVMPWAVKLLGTPRGCWCPLRDYQLDNESTVIEAGFSFEQKHALLARLLAPRVPELNLAPVRVI